MSAIIVIAASSGALEPLRAIIEALPPSCSASVFVAWHIGKRPSRMPDILNGVGNLYAAFAGQNEPVQPGRVYVAPLISTWSLNTAWSA